jgi:hypothetical protein
MSVGMLILVRPSSRAFSSTVGLLLLITVGSNLWAEEQIRLSPNEFESVRYLAKLWVKYERLPTMHDKQSRKDETEFREAWAEANAKAANVDSAWTSAFEKNPLLERASKCLDRCNDLEWQYNLLRNGIRQQYGLDGLPRMDILG